MTHTELGIFGEDRAVDFLLQKGWQILRRNFRYNRGEIDIVAREGDTIVVVEVKTRETAAIGEPYKAVTRSKQRQIIRTADAYIKQEGIRADTRFDIISIVHNRFGTRIEHIESAFFPTS